MTINRGLPALVRSMMTRYYDSVSTGQGPTVGEALKTQKFYTLLYDAGVLEHLRLWLDASDASTISLDTGVSGWVDKSAYGNNLSQGSGSLQPAYVTNLGHRNVYFDGSAVRVEGATDLFRNTDFEVFMLCNVGAGSANFGRLLAHEGSGVGNRVYNLGVDSSSPLKVRSVMDTTAGDGKSVVESASSVGNWHVYGHRLGSDILSLDIDGVQVDSDSPAGITLDQSYALSIGASESGANASQMDLAEVIVFHCELSLKARYAIINSLTTFWGI